MEYFTGAYKKYADFSGRARRKEYWMFYLFYILAFVVLGFIDGLIGTFNIESGIGILTGIFAIATILPALAIAARRLHDTNRSGWWQLIIIIPLIGPIVLLVFLVLKGNENENRFGDNPLTALA